MQGFSRKFDLLFISPEQNQKVSKIDNMFSHRSKLCIYFIFVITISSSQQQQRRPPQRPVRPPPRQPNAGPNRQGLPPPPSRGGAPNRSPPFQTSNSGSGRIRPSFKYKTNPNIRPPPNQNRPPLPELNRPPRQPNQPFLLKGFDLVDFEIPEDTPVGSEVYTLKASQPSGDRENERILYTISGDYFTVDINSGKLSRILIDMLTIKAIIGSHRILFIFQKISFSSGVIRLREKLDREKQDKIDVVVTIQDESFRNIVPQHREITGNPIYSVYHPFIINLFIS